MDPLLVEVRPGLRSSLSEETELSIRRSKRHIAVRTSPRRNLLIGQADRYRNAAQCNHVALHDT